MTIELKFSKCDFQNHAMLEFESVFSFIIVEFITSEFSLASTIKYESESCIISLLNIKYLFKICSQYLFKVPLQ